VARDIAAKGVETTGGGRQEEILRRIEERWRDLPKASSDEVEKWIREGRE
jgi:hypothetical protein